MKKISTVLIESQETRKQLIGDYYYNGKYCALGALGCNAGVDFENEHPFAGDIVRMYDVDPDTYVIMPEGHTDFEFKHLHIYHAIMTLNDTYNWTFKQIGEWVKSLEKEGVIQYEEED